MEQYYVSRSIANFGAKLCKEADSCRPIICSPLSAEIVMAMLALGCKDKSNAEILRALGIPDNEALLSSFAFVTSTLKTIRGATLNVANKIYVRTCTELKPSIKRNAEEIFGSSIEHIDFNSQEAAAYVINAWLAQQTNNNNTVLGATLDVTTRLLLLNTIYFQGVWENPFDTRLNTKSLFHTPYNTTTEVTLMRIPKSWFNYGVNEALKARLLQLKFEGGEASMVIVLPDEADGLKAMLQKLNSGHNIMADVETLKKTELDVMMPIFEPQITSQLNLVTHLMKLGIRSVFDERRSEVEMLTANDILLGSNSGQDTLIRVDGRGSTKTADCSKSTDSKVDNSSTDHGIECFVANRPFLYIIIVRGLPIFMGSYRGSQHDILNYSCNHLIHTFSLSVSTFYARYDNRLEQQRLTQNLDNNARNVIWDAIEENRLNTLIDLGPHHFRITMELFDIDKDMYRI